MRFLGNLIWLVFGGLITAIEYFVASLVLMVTIVGIPFGIQTLKLGALALWPFGRDTITNEFNTGCLGTIMNAIWLLTGGIWIFATHIIFGLLLTITIVGIPFGKQHFKLAALALTPFGREMIYT